MAQQEETRYIGTSAALTRLSDGVMWWVLDESGPFEHTSFIQYLADNKRSYALIRKDGLYIYDGTNKPWPEPTQSERPLTYMHQREDVGSSMMQIIVQITKMMVPQMIV